MNAIQKLLNENVWVNFRSSNSDEGWRMNEGGGVVHEAQFAESLMLASYHAPRPGVNADLAFTRDANNSDNSILADQLTHITVQLNKALCARGELEKELVMLKQQHESTVRDYEETMMERSAVLEENNKLSEERDRLKDNVKHLSDSIQKLINLRFDRHLRREQSRQQTERLIQVSEEAERVHETALARKDGLIGEVCGSKGGSKGFIGSTMKQLTEEDEGRDNENGPPLYIWRNHTIQLALQSTNPKLGIVLGGGKGDDLLGSTVPIFVKDVFPGCPFENHLQRLDFIVIVNDIDVSWMDQRSVVDILSNSCNLNMIVKRRNPACRVTDVVLPQFSEFGVEFDNGVFINKLHERGAALESGLSAGAQLVHINGIPVRDAVHAESLVRASNGQLVVGVAETWTTRACRRPVRATAVIAPQENKHRSRFLNKVHDKLFGRSGAEKARAVIAQASLDACTGELLSLRHGSLRTPSMRINLKNEAIVRTGSLRAASGAQDRRQANEFVEQLIRHHYSQSHEAKSLPICVEQEDPVKKGKLSAKIFHKQVDYTSSVNNSEWNETSASDFRLSCAKNTWSPSIPPSTCGEASARLLMVKHQQQQWPQAKSLNVSDARRVNTRSPALPQPPPYPGPRSSADSLSASSSNSCVPPSSSTSYNHCYSTYAPLKECNTPRITTVDDDQQQQQMRQVTLARNDDGKFGLTLENASTGGVVIAAVSANDRGQLSVGDQLLDVCGINMRSANKQAATRVLHQLHASHNEVAILLRKAKQKIRVVRVPRASVRLCGGNAVGILIEATTKLLQVGERVLAIDGIDMSEATLEEAICELRNGRNELVELSTEFDGGERLNRLRKGIDGDAFYMRVNIDRYGRNSDELDVKKGEIVYVDNTLFMGVFGRWRAWRVDQEGRQRQCGIIPSLSSVGEELRSVRRGKSRLNAECRASRPPYERVEKVSSPHRRPIVLLSAYIAPFMQSLIDEHANKFAQCVAECRALEDVGCEAMKDSTQWIEVRKREKLFEMISVNVLKQIIKQGFHCVLDVTPQAIERLHSMRLYPIVIKIKFKSVKQLRELAEDSGSERLSNKAARELLEHAEHTDVELEKIDCTVSTISIGNTYHGQKAVRYVCQQILAIVEHEQKRTVWLPSRKHFRCSAF